MGTERTAGRRTESSARRRAERSTGRRADGASTPAPGSTTAGSADRGGSDPLPEVDIYADGACKGNPGPGGWGAILSHAGSGRRVEISGFEPATTNNRMELRGVLEALRRLKRPSSVRVVSDSRYLVQGMSEWIVQWRRNGWRTSDRKPVKNRDLWEELIELGETHRMRFEWIEGHAGHPENERCDRLANEAIAGALERDS